MSQTGAVFLFGTSICQNDGDENVGISQEYNSKKVGISQKSEGLKSWDIPNLKHRKKMGYPKKLPGELLSDATGSVAEMGFQNGNRHFAKRISPIKSYH